LISDEEALEAVANGGSVDLYVSSYDSKTTLDHARLIDTPI
jgi:hypothetical protein